ncbi:MAG: flagellar biosynthesis anti-sigma factor FlgM [Gammaproteobacteria bacterium]
MVAEVNGPNSNAVRGLATPAAQQNTSAAANRGGGAAQPKGDVVSLTDDAARLAELAQAVAAAPDTDAGRVSELREAIASGSYQIDYQRTASKLIDIDSTYPDMSRK